MTHCNPQLNLQGRDKLTRLADFLFEAGMLRKTPRSGYQFLGTGSENVAEHSFRTSVVGYVLACEAEADPARTALMCLFHDFHESRIGDFNYVNRIYNTCNPRAAMEHALEGTGLESGILDLLDELERAETLEAKLAQDADQIDLILNLKQELDLGNKYAGKWMEGALKRLRTEAGATLAATIARTDHTDWWFIGPDKSWWERKNGTHK
ncbi:HD domain-containing protein [Oleidesulfovibrio sp.]|uniref:HD domain-containing protein n=1 Tax=Oleidesulfovibrio sp. TaxID=2909707 RepID=UPI003A84F3E8